MSFRAVSAAIHRSLLTLAVLAGTFAAARSAEAQVPPSVYPADSAFTPITCSDPTSIPSQDSCADEARDHRNIIGGGSTPAYLLANDGTYLFLRLRVEADPTQSGAFKPFAWGFGLDADADGEFEAYITLIGQGGSDRVEIQDQDPDNGTTPDRTGPTALTPIYSDLAMPSWAISSPAPGGNFCVDDTDAGDFYITIATPLTVLRDFGALGGVVAYGGSSSMFSGIQNDFVCADGTPPSCTTGATCPSGTCLVSTGVCAPPVDPFFVGCLDEDVSPVDMIDDGCLASTPHCILGSTGSRCVECEVDGHCDDGTDCTTDACVTNACSNTAAAAGTPCSGGVCDGSASAMACVACVDDASGPATDSGCGSSAPLCDTSGTAPICVPCVDDAMMGTDSGCGGGAPVCDASGATSVCVACRDAVVGGGQDDGCTAGEPVCDTSGAAPLCVACVDDASGGTVDSGCASGAPLCDTSGAAPVCVACFDDTAGGLDTGCVSGSPACDGSSGTATCVTCVDDASAGAPDDGCVAPDPICDTSGASPVCVGCVENADCPGGACVLATNDCSSCVDDATGATDTGCGGASPVCEASGVTNFCVACEDDASGTGADFGCASGAPLCDTTRAAPVCVECFDDTTGGTDTGCATSAPACDASGASAVCRPCLDDQPVGSTDDGCSASAPACDESGTSSVCVECLVDGDCAGGVCDAASNTCVACRDDVSGGVDSGCASGAPICDASGGAPVCVPCVDTSAPGTTDEGCMAASPACDTSGATPMCVGCLVPADCAAPTTVCTAAMTCAVCQDDTVGGTDSGCSATSPACSTAGATPVCQTCEDTATGTGIDNGCETAAPLCDTSGTAPLCVECLGHDDCGVGTICGPADTCVPGCTDDADCAGTPATPLCDTTASVCVECRLDTHCAGGQLCDSVSRTCGPGDTDDDGVPDDVDLDDDNDGIPDREELGGSDLSGDTDGDGVPDYRDPDDVSCADADTDGVCDALPLSVDQDGDGVPNHLDLDADNDGVVDLVEGGGEDADGDGRVDGFTDLDGDGQHDAYLATPLPLPNTDMPDALRDFLDRDADGDGITDTEEAGGADADGDGVIDGFVDADGDGLHDPLAGDALPEPDTDMDGRSDRIDVDADADGSPDATEGHDMDGDGVPDVTPSDADADADGIDDAFDPSEGGTPATLPDHDGDGAPDYQDVDDDGDGIPTLTERMDGARHGEDINGRDGPNWLDLDSDGDGFGDTAECPSPVDGCPDTDGDGIPDYLDPNGMTDGGVGMPDGGVTDDAGEPGGLSGGALCSASPQGGSPAAPLALLGLVLGLAFVRRRRRSVARAAVALLASAVVLGAAAGASAQGVRLDHYRGAETSEDGFAISRPTDRGHLRFGARLHLDYALNPLVFEARRGDASSEILSVVEHQLVADAGFSLGLFDRVVVYAGLPVNLAMEGATHAGLRPDGTTVGDPYFGVRVRLYGEREDMFAIAAQVTGTMPLAQLAHEEQQWSGSPAATLHPEILGEVRPIDRLRVAANLGARIRETSVVSNVRISHELTFGLGVTVEAVEDLLDVLVEIYGSSPFEEFGDRESSPIEAIAGVRLRPEEGWAVGLAGGLGLQRGYGAPDFRGVLTVGWADPVGEEPAPVEPPAPPADRDGDGLVDERDECPDEPEDADGFQDDDGCPDVDNDEDGIPDTDDGCPIQPEDADEFEDEDGCPDPDNDGDGHLDADDGCPLEAEDVDGFEDEDGCPDTDNDQDTVADADDRCPLDPGRPEDDGCPVAVRVDRETGRIVILQRVEFATNRDVILERSEPTLEEVRGVLAANPVIRLVRVEGHTDDRGRDSRNMDLSRRRARSVIRWLVDHGVEAERLTAFGCGEMHPTDSNDTADGRQTNRRVEFILLDPRSEGARPILEGCEETPIDYQGGGRGR